ncbi:MAG: DUF1926 domain-containing protein [Chitinivibrionales bacterium]|nr:DUF1926 domain-containing protein [Chitinivibrionales bacterium]
MKRNAVAFLLRPFKNALLPKDELKRTINDFIKRLIRLSTDHHNLRFNIAVPGYVLEFIDPLFLVQLRELKREGRIEWLTCGYTEPFLSFSPRKLSQENIRHGLDTCQELLEERPAGFIPSFSNWEPSFIDIFKNVGIQYMVLSKAIFPEEAQNRLGYWITEQAGIPMPMFPVTIFRSSSVPRDIASWIREAFENDISNELSIPLLCIDYLIPLLAEEEGSLEWLISVSDALESILAEYQLTLFSEYLSVNPPLGLQYIPPSLVFKRDDPDSIRYFLNYLHTFDQIGIIQRKMMEVCENVYSRPNPQWIKPLKKKLFFAQDINRYVPSENNGFMCPSDRIWSYGAMMEIESELHKKDKIQGGQIKISDLLKDGSKTIVMSNRPLKAYIDHKNGGHVFELDYRHRKRNLCAAFNPEKNVIPRIITSSRSKTSFVDHIFDTNVGMNDFIDGRYKEQGDFYKSHYDYKVKKSATGVKTVLVRTGSISLEKKKNFPLSIEKVFGFEKDVAALSFVYQLSSHSLLSHSFRLAIELNLMISGVLTDEAYMCKDGEKPINMKSYRIAYSDVSKWKIEDAESGIRLDFTTQKPVDVWCCSSPVPDTIKPGGCGVLMVISSLVNLEENTLWSLIGKMECTKIRMKRKAVDAL